MPRPAPTSAIWRMAERDGFAFIGLFGMLFRMLIIRLQRVGKKHQPSYRITVSERRSKVGAPPTEQLGSYDPFTKKAIINKERVAHWLKVGAKPSDTVWNLFIREKAVEGKVRQIKMNKKKATEGLPAEASAKAGVNAAAPADAKPAATAKPVSADPADVAAPAKEVTAAEKPAA